ncbi:MAG: hypothetical protein IJU56_09075 [Clostridia bacterium]|nr:hypothetical protein [Clostridia bacterium]
MKKLMKRACSLALCLLLLFAVCSNVLAAQQGSTILKNETVDAQDEGVDEQDEGADVPDEPQPPDTPDTPDAPDTPQPQIVARLYICCRVLFFGHTWIYVENKTQQPLQVGVVYVAPGQGVSVGTHKLRRADGGGVYYNVEAYMTHKRGSSGTVARGMDLTAAQLQTVNDRIVNNNSWSLSNNCNRFATRVWNSVAPDHVNYTFLPLSEKGKIGSGGAPSMTNPSRDQVLRQNGSGFGASTYRVKDGSLILAIG